MNALLTEEDAEPSLVVDLTPNIPPHNGAIEEGPEGYQPPEGQTNLPEESMIAPIVAGEDYVVISGFYDVNASEEERMNSIVVYNNMVQNNVTTNFKSVTEQEFDVVSVFSGIVTRVNSTLLYGNMVEILHDNGLTTTYYSLGNVAVAVDEEVGQGDVIGTAGTCEIDAENGIQVRLRVQKDGINLNPESVLGNRISDIN